MAEAHDLRTFRAADGGAPIVTPAGQLHNGVNNVILKKLAHIVYGGSDWCYRATVRAVEARLAHHHIEDLIRKKVLEILSSMLESALATSSLTGISTHLQFSRSAVFAI